MKKMYFTVAAIAAFAFFACSNNDKDDNPSSSSALEPSSSSNTSSSSSDNSVLGACYSTVVDGYLDWAFCLEPMTSSACEDIGYEFDNAVSFPSSCPPEYKYKCEYDGVNAYFYGDEAEPDDCEIFK